MKNSILLSAVLLVGSAVLIGTPVYARGSTPKPQPVIYVTSQGPYYDSIALTDLPMQGKFQKLEAGGQTGL